MKLTDDDRLAVANAETTIADIAAMRGVSRQAVHQAFARRGWPTTPAAAQPAADDRSPSSGYDAPASASPSPEAPADAISALLAQLGAGDDDDDDVRASIADHARRAIATNALLTLSQATNLLSQSKVAPGALKAVSQAQLAAVDQLKALGLLGKDLSSVAISGGMTMRIVEMTAEEVEAVRAETEADFRNSFGGSVRLDAGNDDDDPPPAEIASVEAPGCVRTADNESQATSHRPPPRHAVRGLKLAHRRNEDLDALKLRIMRSIERRGRATWRTMAIAHGLEGPRDGDEIADVLASAAASDDDLAGQIISKLSDLEGQISSR